MFNNKSSIEINKKILIFSKLREQQEQNKINEQIREAERHKIDEWWQQEQAKIVPWTEEERKFYTKMTFTPDEKTSEAWIRSQTNRWKRLENR
jgi:hypothetical protein